VLAVFVGWLAVFWPFGGRKLRSQTEICPRSHQSRRRLSINFQSNGIHESILTERSTSAAITNSLNIKRPPPGRTGKIEGMAALPNVIFSKKPLGGPFGRGLVQNAFFPHK